MRELWEEVFPGRSQVIHSKTLVVSSSSLSFISIAASEVSLDIFLGIGLTRRRSLFTCTLVEGSTFVTNEVDSTHQIGGVAKIHWIGLPPGVLVV